MTHTFKLVRRRVRLRALLAVSALLVTSACDNSDNLAPTTTDGVTVAPVDAGSDSTGTLTDTSAATLGDSTDTTGVAVLPADTLSEAEVEASEAMGEAAFVSARTTRGIAFGPTNVPNDKFGSTFSGSVRAVGPGDVLRTLEAARRAGARVVLRLSAGNKYWLNKNKSVNLDKWKRQVARFKRVNLKPYIADGTLMGHYVIDEPHDASNFGGRPVPYRTIEAMAKYSKQLWPGLATVVRSYPNWLAKASFRWKYLDAVWAQYSARKGPAGPWMKTQVSFARREGLGLIVGLNFLDGGSPSGRRKNMSASQIRSWGKLMVQNSVSCGFFGHNYSAKFFGRSDVRSAIAVVASAAKNRSRQSCRS